MSNTVIPSETELDKLLNEKFTCSFRPGYVTVEDFVLPIRFRDFETSIREFEVFDSDVWICGFPKTGTNWISEIAWLIAHDLDYDGAKKISVDRTKLFDFSFLFDDRNGPVFGKESFIKAKNSIDACKEQEHPRQIKTHLPFQLIPEQIRNGTKQPKVIYMTRNAMDVCVSYYHQSVNFEKFSGSLEDLCTLFLFDKVNYGPFSKHVLSFWEVRNRSNILFLKYEDVKHDLPKVINEIATFFGKSLSDEESLRLQEHVSFNSMKNNPALNKENFIKIIQKSGGKIISPFIRSGKVGGYKSEMPAEFIPQFHYWMRKRFEGSGLSLIDD